MDIEKIGKAITFLRKRAGYTQKDLAERIGVSDKAVSKWERGLGLPDVSCLRKLSLLLDTDTDSLLVGDVIYHGSGWHGILVVEENACGIDVRTPIYDKPMVYYLLSYFLLVGIKEIMIFCSSGEIEWLKKEFGDGNEFGIHLYYSDVSVAEALRNYPEFTECTNYMVVYDRSFIYGVDQTRFFQKAMLNKDRITVMSLPKGTKPHVQKLSFDNDKRIISAEDGEEVNTQYNYYSVPVLFCPKEILDNACEDIDIIEAIVESARKEDYLYTEVLDRGFVEIPLDTWDDIAAASSFVKIVQSACGMHIYCLEEIAWRRGMISAEQLEKMGRNKAETEYGKYILSLCHEN